MKYLITILITLIATEVYATDRYFVQPQQNVVVRKKTVEFDADTFIGLQGYYSVVEKLKAEEKAQSVDKETLDKLLELLKILLQKEANGGTAVPQTPITPQEPPKPETPTLDKKVYEIFTRDCKSCHSQEKASGGLVLVGKDNKGEYLNDLTLSQRLLVHDRTYGVGLQERNLKRMPLQGKPLLDADVETLRLWALDKASKEVTK